MKKGKLKSFSSPGKHDAEDWEFGVGSVLLLWLPVLGEEGRSSSSSRSIILKFEKVAHSLRFKTS